MASREWQCGICGHGVDIADAPWAQQEVRVAEVEAEHHRDTHPDVDGSLYASVWPEPTEGTETSA